MLKEIINNKEKRFPLIPQLAPKIRYIRLEARPLCDIYNNWKKTSVNVKLFEKNFRTYLDEMFTINKKYSKILKKYPTIRSISTDGYAVSIGFEIIEKVKCKPQKEKGKQKSYKKKEPKEMKDFKDEYDKLTEKNQHKSYYNNPMIFDATEIKTQKDFLDNFDIGGVDPGNDIMLHIVMENGIQITIHKNYYYDISHINRNRLLLDEKKDKDKMNEIYSEMALENTKTTNIDEFMKYVKQIRKHWQRIWTYCTSKVIFSLKFDSFVNKEYAMAYS
jgi:hypothetical protein